MASRLAHLYREWQECWDDSGPPPHALLVQSAATGRRRAKKILGGLSVRLRDPTGYRVRDKPRPSRPRPAAIGSRRDQVSCRRLASSVGIIVEDSAGIVAPLSDGPSAGEMRSPQRPGGLRCRRMRAWGRSNATPLLR